MPLRSSLSKVVFSAMVRRLPSCREWRISAPEHSRVSLRTYGPSGSAWLNFRAASHATGTQVYDIADDNKAASPRSPSTPVSTPKKLGAARGLRWANLARHWVLSSAIRSCPERRWKKLNQSDRQNPDDQRLRDLNLVHSVLLRII